MYDLERLDTTIHSLKWVLMEHQNIPACKTPLVQLRPLQMDHSILAGQETEQTLFPVKFAHSPLGADTGQLGESHLHCRGVGQLALVLCFQSDHQAIQVKSERELEV